MTLTASVDRQAADVAEDWLKAFEGLVAEGGSTSFGEVFTDDGWWRDVLTFTWDFRSCHAAEAVGELIAAAREQGAGGFELAPSAEPAYGEDGSTMMVLFALRTRHGRGTGVAHLASTPAGWRAATIFTQLDELTGLEETTGRRRPHGGAHGAGRAARNWLEERTRTRDFTDTDPEVMVIGGGHAGLSLAARLGRLDVPTLVIERAERIGDSWRHRYRSLVLHDPVGSNHLPYLPFPSSWPVFTPKDKMGDWLETYASALELNVWTNAEVGEASYDKAQARWTVTVRRDDGSERSLHPRHVVMATGLSGNLPHVPEISGQDTFGGSVIHSRFYDSGAEYADKRVLVVGAGNSAHDICQDLAEHGAQVTMLQRSETYVIRAETVVDLMLGLYSEDGPPTEIADLIAWSTPNLAAGDGLRAATAAAVERDREVHEGLKAAGFKLTLGPDDTGTMMLFLERNGGYYIDVGCSQLIVDGTIAVKQGVEIDRLEPGAVVFNDGERQDMDAVVLATGYTGILDTARDILGEEAVRDCGPVWGLDEEGELRSVWRRSGQPGLWFMGGNLSFVRPGSKYLALQLKADLEGLV
ncbi:flavin-containing monooxygenase [Microbacterium sp. A93]|uniref:flavin-containing monooxygenase n=1 Tax=Microbacterium sp. A93 TaxID=3450716 RepID=UPI003F43F6AE